MREVRLPSIQQMVILAYLLSLPSSQRRRGCHGLAIYNANPKELGRTSIYAALSDMVARHYLAARDETDEERAGNTKRAPRRRFFTVTAYGEQCYRARLAVNSIMHGVAKPAGAY
jgi:hypothetical protein